MRTATKSGSWAEWMSVQILPTQAKKQSAANRLLFEIELFFLQHGQVHVQSLVDISGEQLLHGRQVMLHMVRIKGVVVGQAVRELDVDGRESCFHQFQIDQQASGAAIAITKCNKRKPCTCKANAVTGFLYVQYITWEKRISSIS